MTLEHLKAEQEEKKFLSVILNDGKCEWKVRKKLNEKIVCLVELGSFTAILTDKPLKLKPADEITEKLFNCTL